jgi:redox-sensitive bicupin YhaK (pirin superfamily)
MNKPKAIDKLIRQAPAHWVGDGFPVRNILSVQREGARISPFLLLDYAGPYDFAPGAVPRGVGQHPHRGFETVTIVYRGELEHRDSAGNAGRIGPGDVQWMTAAGGVLHEEFHSRAFTQAGGVFEAVQLWVNLPAKHKLDPPRYQTLLAADIPVVELPDGAGRLRVIAGAYGGQRGPAQTFTPVEVWDLKLAAGAGIELPFAEGHAATLVVLYGQARVNGAETLGEAQAAQLTRAGARVRLEAVSDAVVLVLSGAPIDEPIASYGPFVMNTREEIAQAIEDYQSGRMGGHLHPNPPP